MQPLAQRGAEPLCLLHHRGGAADIEVILRAEPCDQRCKVKPVVLGAVMKLQVVLGQIGQCGGQPLARGGALADMQLEVAALAPKLGWFILFSYPAVIRSESGITRSPGAKVASSPSGKGSDPSSRTTKAAAANASRTLA